MTRNISDPQYIRFLVENYEKTEKKRAIWFKNNKQKVEETAKFTERCKGYTVDDVLKYSMEQNLPSLVKQHKTSAVNRLQKSLHDGVPTKVELKISPGIIELGLGNPYEDPRLLQNLTIAPIMRPVDESTKSVLYKNVPVNGRVPYLKLRNREKPEDKYYFPEYSSHDYGWRLKDSCMLAMRHNRGGRVNAMKRSEDSRCGPQPDPTYYQEPVDNHFSKCRTT